MVKNDLIMRNPLRVLEEKVPMPADGRFGALLARAGVGKTALLVQLALNALLKGQSVLHISLDDPVGKVALWYEEVLRNIETSYPGYQVPQLWEQVQPNRFIMTFKVEGFSVPKLEERLTDLIEQKIISPQVVIVDGLPFDAGHRDMLNELKALATRLHLTVWFTVLTHRHEAPGADGLPHQLDGVKDLFEVMVQLLPQDQIVQILLLKGAADDHGNTTLLTLDPHTMLVSGKA